MHMLLCTITIIMVETGVRNYTAGGFKAGNLKGLCGDSRLEVYLQFSDFVLVSSSCSLFDEALHRRRCLGNLNCPEVRRTVK